VVAGEKAAHDSGRLRIVVTCSNRKAQPVPDRLRLREIPSDHISSRVKTWTRRLSECDRRVPAVRLYSGEHWDVVRRVALQGGSHVEIWICSAGYGLIPATATISPYSATFSVGHPDSVPGGHRGAARWWEALGEWSGPAKEPRTITDLAASDRCCRLLLVLSAPYLMACRADIAASTKLLKNPGQVSIISAGTKSDLDLNQYLLPVDARLQPLLGGTRRSLNVRVLEHLLRSGTQDHAAMRDSLTALLAQQPPLPSYQRQRTTDAGVQEFIRRHLDADRSATHTRLLRTFRETGQACEQGRFAAIFWAVAEESR
jgi:hypothetical protein